MPDKTNGIVVNGSVLEKLKSAVENALNERADGFLQLNEKKFARIKNFKVEIFPNESKHPGLPHCKVTIDDKSASFKLCDGTLLVGDLGRYNAAASKEINKHKSELLTMWNDTRPDDQKLANKKS
ncbi:MAG: hypothetical protein C0473_00630 [Cyanobacteria bacterium DS3.002]|nr:hypothetical protein [Cyanobacteria bacterium DS3.002]MBA4049464.1 hypothetical protein [Cyanobacteria bacterium DS2.008]MBA4078318.1 hypothetical protein [Cyanobacteria bacterium PR.023]